MTTSLRSRATALPLVAVLAITLEALGGGTPATRAAGTPTPLTNPTAPPTVIPTVLPPTVGPHKTAAPAPTPTVRPVREKVKRVKRASPAKHVKTKAKRHSKSPKKKRRSKKKGAKPTATPTATPPLSLRTEDSIAPVSCNGPAKPNAPKPFLYPPFHGWTSLVSYFDHDSPNFLKDGLVVTASGMRASPDALHQASDFPAYWNTGMRQYLYYDGHNGYDLNLVYQPVYASATGKVIFSALEYPTGPAHGYGQMVMIDHHNGYVTLYGHFSKLMVHAGQKVKRGQQIGVSGNTGHSSGPHLHFTVFHNCTPTDPYGWKGTGSDPLTGYKGESSRFLWKVVPRLLNPPPAWPGLSAIPSARTSSLLVKLPSPAGGSSVFTDALRRALLRDERLLAKQRVRSRLDMIDGALRLLSPVKASLLYRLPGVASIAASFSLGDAHDDVVHSLTQAALVHPHKLLPLNRSSKWKGYLVQWQGRTVLVGTGLKGKAIKVRIQRGRHSVVTRDLQTDASKGQYGVDLGHLSPGEVAALTHQLEGGKGGISIRTLHNAPVSRTTRRGSDAGDLPLVLGGLALLVATAVGALGYRGWQYWSLRRS